MLEEIGCLRPSIEGSKQGSWYVAMLTAEECQRRADEAKTLAARTLDLWEREILLRIATQWELLAAHEASEAAKGWKHPFATFEMP